MKLATTLRNTLAAAALCMWAGTALAQAVAEPLGNLAGYYVHDHVTKTTTLRPNAPNAVPVVIYDNTTSAANFGISSTDLTATWGDLLATTGTGTLSEMMFTLYNSSSSAGPVLTANFQVDLFDGVTFAALGSYTVNINFGGGLPVGYYTFLSVTGLEPLAIDLPTNDVIVTQTVLSLSGTASRLGIASLDPPTVGSSGPDMYIDASTIGAAGWYTVGANANPGYLLSVVTAPVPTEKSSWGALKNLYR